MKVHGKLHSISLVSASLVLLLILVSSTASAATTTSNVAGIDYQYKDWGQYPVIDLFGEKYVPLFEENDPIWKSHVDRIAKLVIDSEGSYSFTTGDIFDLGQGYSLQVKQVDVDGNKVWLEFDKNGQYVDDQILSTEYGGNTWNCTLDNIQGVKNVVVLKVYVNQIYQGSTDGIVQIDGIWLIDYANSRTLQIGDKFGDYTLATITSGVDESNPGSLVFKYLVTITDLGTLRGGYESYARGINNNGQVAGYSDTGTDYGHAFIWQNGVMNDLGDLNENYSEDYIEHYSRAEGINDKGQIVGVSSAGVDQLHTFIWQNGLMTDIGTLDHKLCSEASGINENGQIVGYSDDGMGNDMHAFLWLNGSMTDLGTLPGGYNNCAYKINDKGQVVGYSSTQFGAVYAFLWQNGTMTDLGTLAESSSCAYGINEKGQVVGYSETETGEYHAFLWQNGTMIDLGTLPGGHNSCAYGINEKGQVVGYSDTETGATRAFLWQNGTMIDLGTLAGSNSCAYGINDKGQIVGCSDAQTGSHATLWTVQTSNTRPIAAFSAYPVFGVKPFQVSFKDKSTGSPTSWSWNFGDGNTSTAMKPVHTYYKAGRYSVRLTVENDVGSDTRTRYNYIVVM
jgi:S-layer protein (TIGR01567 family)